MKVRACIAHLLVAGLAMGAAVGCGSGGAIDEFIKLETEKGAAFEVGGDDCEAKAKSVAAWREKNNARYQELQGKLKEEYPKGPPEDVMKKHGDALSKSKGAVMDAMMKCTDHPAFAAIFDKED
jgi:hypothetical protein